MSSNVTIVIPARFQSSRFPGKPLVEILGISMLERVWRIATYSRASNNVIIATDDIRIEQHARKFGAQVIMTSKDCRNGTERVYEAVKDTAAQDDIILSLQGDAVLTPPWVIDHIIDSLQTEKSSAIGIATPAQALEGHILEAFLKQKNISPSSGTTVTFDLNHKALYFSKQVIPYSHSQHKLLYRHIGLYAYRFHTLQHCQALAPTPLEKIEKLEQLRALENNIPIKIAVVDYKGRTHASIDTPQDVEWVKQLIQQEGELVL